MNKKASKAQVGFWLIKNESVDSSNNIITINRINGAVDIEKLKESILKVLSKHEILNSRFFIEDNLLKVKTDKLNHQIDCFSVDKYEDFIKYLHDDNTEMSLENGPLVEFNIIFLRDAKIYIIYAKLHHIIGDEWSVNLILTQISKEYNSEKLSDNYKSYYDYVEMIGNLEEEEYNKKLENIVSKTNKEIYYVPKSPDNRSVEYFEIDDLVYQNLKILSEKYNLSIYMSLISMYFYYKYIETNNFIQIGLVLANRMDFDYIDTVGLFSNILPFQMERKTEDFMSDFCDVFINIFDSQNILYEDILEKSKIKRKENSSYLFDTIFINRDNTQHLNLNGANVEEIEINLKERIRFNKIYSLIGYQEYYKLKLDYNNLFYDKEYIIKETKKFLEFISNIDLKKIKYLKTENFITMFEQSVKLNRNKTAIINNKNSITYDELMISVNKMVNYFSNHNIPKGSYIVVHSYKEIESIIAMIAIMKYGAVYIPVNYTEKIMYKDLIEEINPYLVLDTRNIREIISKNDNISCPNTISLNQKETAYIIYTSGTTGKPKGVKISHEAFYLYIKAIQNRVYNDVNLQKATVASPLTFDASLKQLQLLTKGYTLYLIDSELRKQTNEYMRLLEEEQIDILDTTPTELEMLIENGILKLKSLKCILVGGEDLNKHIWKKLMNSTIDVYNHYGPTECTINVTCTKVKGSNPILGKELDSYKCILVDEKDNVINKIFSKGELLVSGNIVTQGYVDGLYEDEKFIFLKSEGKVERFYRTGDIMIKDNHHNYIFIDRKDRQIKLRGFRIELSEIESIIRAFKNVKDVKVLTEGKGVTKKIIALIKGDNIDLIDLNKHLYEKLETYKIPSKILFVNDFVLKESGKIDESYYLTKKEVDSEKYDIKNRELFPIWKKTLGIEDIGIEDNFFEMGGNSLTLIKYLSELKIKYPYINFNINHLFQYQTIKTMDCFIECNK